MGVEGALSPLKRPWSVSPRSAPIGPIWTKKIWAQRARRVLSNHHGPVLLGTIVSEKKILGSYLSDLDEKNMGVEGATSPLNDHGPVLLGTIVSEKKIVKEKFFFP
ncbi:hypothetical protein V1477_006345 [Vespula maculifrons]|uniref:Uncharacterized protein n=1 Tax=Vespula maculifrons TaxID=7453 RepID=A0ABD2CK78_VESMC